MIPVRKTLLMAALFGLVIFWPLLTQAYWPARWPLDAAEHAIGRDFVNVWVGGRLLLEGNWQTLFDIPAYLTALQRLFHPSLAPHYWSYPPTSFLVAAVLAVLPYWLALLVWTAAGLVAITAVTRVGLAASERRIATIALLLAPATVLNVICGQNGFFTAALLAGGLLLLDTRPVLAGVLIGLLSYKPHFGIVVAPVLLALGAWRTIAAALATALAMVLASIAAFGIEPWQAFVASTMPNQAQMLKDFHGFFTTMLVSPYATLRHLGAGHGAAMALQVAVGLAAVGAAVVCARRTRDPDTLLMLVVAATFVAAPYALTYDLPVLMVAIARLAARRDGVGWTPVEAAVYGTAWALPLASAPLVVLGLPLAPVVVIGILIMIANTLLRRNRSASSAYPAPGLRASE